MESYKDSIFEPLEYYRDYGKGSHAKVRPNAISTPIGDGVGVELGILG